MRSYYDSELDDIVVVAGDTPWAVLAVEPQDNQTLVILFSDGTKRAFDCSGLIAQPFFSSLTDQAVFMSASAEHGTVVWNNDIDIAPEYLYENSKVL